ncbi:hypothetical protein SO802_000909 [Lithocarpus litseifolius]|uniref:Uncharacterized protein n=1 Tax=Lithocarpus litseifolius TaxID=425828 RepID=A0AAW2DX42_9ROSI
MGAMIEGAEGAMEEASGGAPLRTAVVVKGEGDGVGLAMAADFWGVVLCVYGDLFQGLRFWMKSWVCVQTLESQSAKGQE